MQFLPQPPDSSLLYVGYYDPWLVVLSIMVAIFASYTALNVADRLAASSRRLQRLAWLSLGAMVMGGGVWAMHFVGMIAFTLPCTVAYDPALTAYSVIPAVLASAVALHFISRDRISRFDLVSGGVLLGAGIGAMHYAGMAAYRLDGLVRYDPGMFGVSIVVAVGLAMLALWTRYGLRQHAKYVRHITLLSALIMGAAASGMHYTAMAAAYFISDGVPKIQDSQVTGTFLATTVIAVTSLLIGLALAITFALRQRDLATRLQAEESRTRRILDTTQEGFVMVDADFVIVEVNPAFALYLQRSPMELQGVLLYDLAASDEDRGIFVLQHQLREQGEHSSYEIELQRRDGSRWPCIFRSTPTYDGKGVRCGSFALVSDLSGQREREIYIRQTLAIFENTAEGVMFTSPEGVLISVNPAFTRITGYSANEALGKKPHLLRSGRHDETFYKAMWREIQETGHWQGEIWNRRKNGEIYPEWLTINAVHDDAGRVQNYVGLFKDISHVKRSESELQRLAHYDALTGLPNRVLLNVQLQHALQRARRHHEQVAILMLDLDGFKNVNDSLGHPAGDALLQVIAERLKEALRAEDMVARLGGDEFAVVLESSHGVSNPGLVAEKIIEVVAEPVEVSGHNALVTASIGIALFPDDGNDAITLLKTADTAMYASKHSGRNTFSFHHPDMAKAASQRLLIEQGLRRALEENQLEVWYQPQFDLVSQALVGSEALVRWRHPERGLVSPAEFVPVAEESGLIVPMGEWVLRQACRDAKHWLGAGLKCGKVAVNVAGPQIERGQFFETVERVLLEVGLAPKCLELEITESFLLRNAEQAMEVVSKLSELGIDVAIDDFGTGYSSLSYLKYLAIDKLKIDQSFVRGLPDDIGDAAITRAVIALGRNLGFRVIAEGVETEAQREYLRSEGCNLAQGYLYSRPLPAVEFEALMRRLPN